MTIHDWELEHVPFGRYCLNIMRIMLLMDFCAVATLYFTICASQGVTELEFMYTEVFLFNYTLNLFDVMLLSLSRIIMMLLILAVMNTPAKPVAVCATVLMSVYMAIKTALFNFAPIGYMQAIFIAVCFFSPWPEAFVYSRHVRYCIQQQAYQDENHARQQSRQQQTISGEHVSLLLNATPGRVSSYGTVVSSGTFESVNIVSQKLAAAALLMPTSVSSSPPPAPPPPVTATAVTQVSAVAPAHRAPVTPPTGIAAVTAVTHNAGVTSRSQTPEPARSRSESTLSHSSIPYSGISTPVRLPSVSSQQQQLLPPLPAFDQSAIQTMSAKKLFEQVDELYLRRNDPACMEQMEFILKRLFSDHSEQYHVLWRMARFLVVRSRSCGVKDEQAQYAKTAGEFCVKASEDNPSGVEARVWHCFALAEYTEAVGVFKAAKERTDVQFQEQCAKALLLDNSYALAGILRAKGRFFFTLPWPKQDLAASERFLHEAMDIAPQSLQNRLYLAYTLRSQRKLEEARALIGSLLAVTDDAVPLEEIAILSSIRRDARAMQPTLHESASPASHASSLTH
eukprot:TRINITY_DN8484_c0_g1_i1.p1 TRINITY_DN8484_c0_g1~~TRINITY_DN8484_c0_g1_i1.p1  ORF type:complete len:598 (+),score=107.49 TRINITY_DN8484_c0_g1_i1:94-1794(+)